MSTIASAANATTTANSAAAATIDDSKISSSNITNSTNNSSAAVNAATPVALASDRNTFIQQQIAIIDACRVRPAVESNLKLIYLCNLRSTPKFELVDDVETDFSQLQLEFNTVQQLLRNTAESTLIDQSAKDKHTQRHEECSNISDA